MKKGIKLLSGLFLLSTMMLSSCSDLAYSKRTDEETEAPSDEFVEADYNKLLAPQNLVFNPETCILKWNEVIGASEYEINVNGRIYSNIKENAHRFTKSTFEKEGVSEYLISVRAISKKTIEEEGKEPETKIVKSNYSSYLYDTNATDQASTFKYALNEDNETVSLGGFSGSIKFDGTTLNVPSSVKIANKEYQITGIADEAFKNDKSLQEVILPTSIKTIGNSAFESSRISKFTLNEGLEVIGDSAFKTNTRLNELSLPSSLIKIGKDAFNHSSIKTLNIPTSSKLEEIGESAFELTSMKTFEFPSTVKLIGKNAFKNNSIEKITFAEGFALKEFPEGCFEGSKKLQNFTLPSSIEVLGANCFTNSAGLRTFNYASNNNLREISKNAFKDCRNLRYVGKKVDQATLDSKNDVNINILNTIEKIDDSAFKGIKINNIIFENDSKLLSIGSDAFNGSIISEISFPDSLLSIGANAFSKNNKLAKINFSKTSKIEYIDSSAFEGSEYINSKKDQRIILGNVLYQASAEDLKASEITNLPDNLLGISNQAFENTKIKSIKMPSSLRQIGAKAFYNCSLLESIDLPSTLLAIGDSAFENCKKVNAISLGNVNSSALEKIGNKAFKNISLVSEISLPNSVLEIGEEAFFNSSRVTNNKGTGSSKLVKFNITNESKLEKIGNKAFSGAILLESFNLPNSVLEIGNEAFKNDTSLLTFNININDSLLESIGNNAFEANGLNQINIPGSILNISKAAFKNCFNLNNVSFAANAFINAENKAILSNTFEGCSELHEITLPDAITTIEADAFLNASLNEGINCKALNIDKNAFRNSKFEESFTDGIVRIGSVLLRYTGEKTVLEASDLEGVTSISSNVFSESNVTSITLPLSLEVIDASAFENCNSLISVNVLKESALHTIKANAFKGCKNLKNLSLSNNVKTIEANAFMNCLSLENVDIKDAKIETISTNSFANCNSLKSIEFNDSIKNIAEYAFYQTSLVKISLPSGLVEIGDYAFANIGKAKNDQLEPIDWEVTPSLNEVTFDESTPLKRIGKYAFNNNVIKNISLPNTNGYILDEYCFANSSELLEFTIDKEIINTQGVIKGANKITKLTLPSSISVASLFGGQSSFVPNTLKTIEITKGSTKIYNNAFTGLGMVEEFIIPNTIEEVGDYAFYGCRGITSINLANVKVIGHNAFNGCSNLVNIMVSTKLDYIGDKAFYSTKYLNNTEKEFVILDGILIKYNGDAKNVTLPNEVKVVAGGAFSGNNTIESITMSTNTSLLCNGAFDSCHNLKEINLNYAGLVDIELKTLDTLSSNITVNISRKYSDLYKKDINWSLYADYITSK